MTSPHATLCFPSRPLSRPVDSRKQKMERTPVQSQFTSAASTVDVAEQNIQVRA